MERVVGNQKIQAGCEHRTEDKHDTDETQLDHLGNEILRSDDQFKEIRIGMDIIAALNDDFGRRRTCSETDDVVQGSRYEAVCRL